MLAWNAAATELLTDFGAVPKCDRNILAYMLTDPHARRLFGKGWAQEAKRMVAQFRVNCDLWAGDAAFLELRERLRQRCPELSAWWKTHDVRGTGSERKLLAHPQKGLQQFTYATFQANDNPAVKIEIYTPA